MKFITTLKKIREFSPCEEGWSKLLRTLNKTKADDEKVSILQILDSNGLDDSLWCLRALSDCDKEIRLFAVWCARQVEHLSTDQRVKNCNDVTERFANGNASSEELAAARAAARVTTSDAASAAASAAALEAASAAALAAASTASWTAAWEAASDAAWAARTDALAAQEKELRRILELDAKEVK